MRDAVKRKVDSMQSRCRKYRDGFERGERLWRWAVRSIVYTYQHSGCFSLLFCSTMYILHLSLLFGVIAGVTNTVGTALLIGYLLYLIPYAICGYYGKKLMKENGAQLSKLTGEVYEEREAYLNEQMEAYGIHKLKERSDVLTVQNGSIQVQLMRDYGNIRIFRNQDENESEACAKLICDDMEQNTLINLAESLSSGEFKKRYTVLAKKDSLVSSMAYLSPTVQLGMIRCAENMQCFRNIEIKGDVLYADTPYTFPSFGVYVDLYSYRPIKDYFEQVDIACQLTVRTYETVTEKFYQAAFLAGNN